MTEVASLLPSNHRLTSVKHYEAGPPPGLEIVETGDTFATTKEEEWISKKKTEVLNTKQIETRVKRQVVLEDGKVVEDSGPMVTTNTTEDTETQEHHQTELRKLGDDEVDGGPSAIEGPEADKSKWVAVPNSDGVVREVKERRVVSREETEEVKETEDVQHLGDITDEEFLAAVRTGKNDLRSVLRSSEAGRAVVSTGPRVIRDTSKSKKVTDTEDTRELSSVLPDGKIVTETQRTTEHEEVDDDELPLDAPESDFHKESSQRYLKTREQEDVDYLANGKNVGHEMRYKTETMEVDKRGDDDTDLFESLSARARRRLNNNKQPHRYRGLENGQPSPLDRKDALTRRPLDFDAEEETRKVETSKWLEHHFGSESRSSNSTLDDEEHPPKTSFFNVTIKSQPVRNDNLQRSYVTTVHSPQPRVYSPVPSEKERNHHQSGYYKGISDWSERRQEHQYIQRQSPSFYHQSPSHHSSSPYHPDRPNRSPIPDYVRAHQSPTPDYRHQHSPVPDYRNGQRSPSPDYGRPIKVSPSPIRDLDDSPTPPQRKRASEKRSKYIERDERSRYDSGYRSSGRMDDLRDDRLDRVEEPPPDYSPPSPIPAPKEDKKHYQKTRFASDTPQQKTKSGNIIGQSIRKLVNKIRSASSERKAKSQRAKRSPSPSYQAGHVIDNNISHSMDRQPVQRYYLGEDPFGGSIYGRENKYDGVKPARTSRRSREDERDGRSQSTLGRFSKSTGRLASSTSEEKRNSQTLPRHLNKYEPPTRLNGNNRSNSTINVSIINTVASPRFVNDGPAKPARTYKSNLARSKSLIVQGDSDSPLKKPNMYTSNSNVHKLNENPSGLKSPGLISSLNRSQKDITDDVYTSRFHRNGNGVDNGFRSSPENNYSRSFGDRSEKKVFLSGLKARSPELFRTLNETDDDWRPSNNYTSTPIGKSSPRNYNGDIYEPPTRLKDTHIISTSSPTHSVLRRGSTSSTDFSETYHTTTRNNDPVRPSVTNTVKTISKKTIPGRDGRAMETIESSETKSITKSHYRSNRAEPPPSMKYYESERRYDSSSKPVVIEVRRDYHK
ncbi:serine/arginine repetitive matrix protein 1 isoform X2 [Sitophilus oryzae]|uniref:Serine/arginine repetitive matrix protein 1 isoform X2 n=1 Tax=Sitophilus oryzae TaxID=7048 RepID=A0A6J2XRT6_SITOR|nr:serine/arginine repetitive matrix protein 1 isoform X2 [Sitophilus oryzae]